MNDIASFSIENSRQIFSKLSLLYANKCLICVRFGYQGSESYITTLLSVNEKTNEVVWDCGPRDTQNIQLMKSGKVIFNTDYNGIKVSFTGEAPEAIDHEGDLAFKTAIPRSITWKERREFYRAKTLLSSPGYCMLTPEEGQSATLKLFDISLAGFSTLAHDAPKDFYAHMNPESPLGTCRLMLPKSGKTIISLDMRYSHIINPDQFKKSHKISYKFINLSRANEDTIQSYIQWMQRERLQGYNPVGLPRSAA